MRGGGCVSSCQQEWQGSRLSGWKQWQLHAAITWNINKKPFTKTSHWDIPLFPLSRYMPLGLPIIPPAIRESHIHIHIHALTLWSKIKTEDNIHPVSTLHVISSETHTTTTAPHPPTGGLGCCEWICSGKPCHDHNGLSYCVQLRYWTVPHYSYHKYTRHLYQVSHRSGQILRNYTKA